ncbi:hypothetical protein JAAARDRAFT_62089 [Jaapia argillacea MUCL 33604]|uniref:Uncharacterized protein n=1 Tax=Jaapia argillacea MUCL 33604 TaxID=933084 RepID=A0A067PB23_9AGAM|nr:hypothetical protein JAAARDRAFT_62089 [Jaapia argillacea MUCL 33604]
MGPQNVIRTWSATPSDLPDGDEADATVTHSELIVLPYIEGPEGNSGMNEKDEGRKGRLGYWSVFGC